MFLNRVVGFWSACDGHLLGLKTINKPTTSLAHRNQIEINYTIIALCKQESKKRIRSNAFCTAHSTSNITKQKKALHNGILCKACNIILTNYVSNTNVYAQMY